MSEERRDLTWFEADTPSYRMGGNLTPMAFMDAFGALMRQVRPDISYGLHHGVEAEFELPHMSIELRSRSPHTGSAGQYWKQTRGGNWFRQQYNNTFRIRIYTANQIQAEEEAAKLERIVIDYKAYLRYAGVDSITLAMGMGRDLDRDGRVSEACYATRDFNVLLGEVWLERAMPIQLISLRSYTGYELVTENVTGPIFAETQGRLEDPPVYVVNVTQRGYSFVEGLDYAVGDEGISWAMEVPPVPYVVTYYRKRLRGSAEIDLPLPAETVAGG